MTTKPWRIIGVLGCIAGGTLLAMAVLTEPTFTWPVRFFILGVTVVMLGGALVTLP